MVNRYDNDLKKKQEMKRELEDDLKKLNEMKREYEYGMKKLEVLNNFLEIGQKVDTGKYSEIDAQILIIQEFLWIQKVKTEFPDMEKEILETPELQNLMMISVSVKKVEPSKQICLPGFEDKPLIKYKKEKLSLHQLTKECFVVGKKEVLMKDVLGHHNKTVLKDFSKYIMLKDWKRGTISEMSEELADYVCRHPHYILAALSSKGVELMLKIADCEEKTVLKFEDSNCDDFCKLIMLGLLSMEICETGQGITCNFSIPSDVLRDIVPFLNRLMKEKLCGKELATYFETKHQYSLKEIYSVYENYGNKLINILIAYGTLEEECFYEMVCKLMQIECSYEDFRRFVYTYGTMSSKLATGFNRITKKRYVAISKEMMQYIVEEEEDIIKEYYHYEKYEDIHADRLKQLALLEPIEEILDQWELSKEELYENLLSYEMMINSGDNIAKVMDEFLDEFSGECDLDLSRFWKAMIEFALYEKIYTLKGYSRMNAEQKYGRHRYQHLFEESSKKNLLKNNIHHVPVKIQEILADIVLLAREGKLSDIFEKERELDGLCHSHLQIEAVLLLCMADAYKKVSMQERINWKESITSRLKQWGKNIKDTEQKEWMEAYFEKSGLDVAEQHNTNNKRRILIGDEETGYYGWSEWEEPEQPIIKEKKIYPNDPCPCGSGKKYKKCCGKKK